MSQYELPLVFFTVIGQCAVGIAVLLTLLNQFKSKSFEEGGYKTFRPAGILIFPLCALAIILSIFHLGQPFAAYRAMSNFGSSWLSREIYAFIALGIVSFVYSYIWWKKPESNSRKNVGVITAVVGILAVFISSRVYALPAHGPWNSVSTVATFIFTATLLGALTLLVILTEVKSSDSMDSGIYKLLGWVIAFSILGIVITLAVFVQGYNVNSEWTGAVGLVLTSPIFWLRIVVGLLLPGALVLKLLTGGKDFPKGVVAITLLGAVIGELGGRALFYYSVMGQKFF